MNKIVAIVGLCGSGKSIAGDIFVKKGYQFIRFGQITLDIVKEKGLEVNEENEKQIRESIRKEHGMGAYATLNLPKINKYIEQSNVIIDGLYSWSEYKILKQTYKENLFILAIYAPPSTRYKRLTTRELKPEDTKARDRQYTPEQAQKRDYSEIENIEKAGPIAMADYTIINVGPQKHIEKECKRIIRNLQ
jgi:dephospho-CoA kinase